MPSKPDKLVLRWALFAYLGVILCPIRYFAPSNILDNTWLFALNYAAARHLVMGRDIVWTWGPLAYFLFPFDIGNNLAQGLAFQTALWVLLLLILWDLFHSGFPLRNLAVFSIFVALSSPDYHQAVYPGNLLLCGALILLVHFRLRGGMIRYVTALVMMGLIPLIQVVGAMVVVGVVAGLIVDRILQERRTALLEVTLALIVPTVVAVVGCRLALGSVQAIAAYVRTSLEFAGNYSVVMSIAGPRKQLVAGLEAVALLASAVFVLLTQDREKARFITLILAIPLVIGARHGLVRQDMAHLVQFFCFLALLLAFVTLATPLNGNFTRIGVAVILLLFAALWQANVSRFIFWNAIGAVSGARTLSLVWHALRFNHLRRSLDEEGRQNFSGDAGIEPEIKAIVGHEPIGFLSNVYGNALIENLNLVLSPVVQRYAANTPYLDEFNAEWIRVKGPRFMIFDGTTIDGRHPWLETPATWAEVYRWYDTRKLTARNLLLERRVAPRFGHFEPLAHLRVRFGEQLSVPPSSKPLFWTMQCSLSKRGKLRALLFRVPEVTVTVDAKNGHAGVFRALVPMLGYPSPGSALPGDLAEFATALTDGGGQAFSVTQLALGGPGKPDYQQYCEAEFLQATPQ